MTDNIQPKRKGKFKERFTFEAVYSDEPSAKYKEDIIVDYTTDQIVKQYVADHPEKFKPRVPSAENEDDPVSESNDQGRETRGSITDDDQDSC